MNHGFTKLFGSILASTIWQETNPTRIVWITMLAMADQYGEVAASVPGLAHAAKVTLPECETALASFLAPDPYSRTKAHDGRRIEPIDGGWLLLNHAKYRERLRGLDRTEYNRVKQAERRARLKLSTSVSNVNHVSQSQPVSADSRGQMTEADSVRAAAAQVGDTPTPPCHPLQALPAVSVHANRVSAFFNRRSTTPWAAAELRAWKKAKAIVADTSAENWTLLESWFRIPDNDPRVIYRRTDMAALLNNWHAEITKAQKNIGSGSQSDFDIAMAEAARNGRKA